MKNFTKINKKIIALVMSLFILLSSLAVSPVYAAGKKYKLMYQDPFTAGGSIIKATSNVPGTDIAKGFSMAQSYIQNTSGDYIGRVYCLEMGNHPYAKNMEDTTSGVWQGFSYKQRIAIQDILALGLEGNMKGSYTDKKDFNNKNTYPVQNKARTNHWIYGNTEYGSGNFSDSEIYIATQLLIWEVTKGWRKTGSLQKTSKSLVSAYSNSHIKTVYNYISDRLYTVNQIPSFTVYRPNSTDINTYNFKVSYNNKSGTYSVNPSSKKLVSTNKNVLKHYTDLAKNKSISIIENIFVFIKNLSFHFTFFKSVNLSDLFTENKYKKINSSYVNPPFTLFLFFKKSFHL